MLCCLSLRRGDTRVSSDNSSGTGGTQSALEYAEYEKAILKAVKKENSKPIWFEVEGPVALFTGREKELSDLHSRIQSSEKTSVISQMVSIVGLGGIGKTELARKYAQKYFRDYDENVIWINAGGKAELVQSFLGLARDNRLGINLDCRDGKKKTAGDIVKEVYRFFADRKSLFIFDNAWNVKCLKEFLPLYSLKSSDNKPYILITSRDRELEGIGCIELKGLLSDDALQFVKKELEIKDDSQDEEIEELVSIVESFPLALRQAVSHILDQRSGRFGLSNYLNQYNKKKKELLDSDVFMGVDNTYTSTTFTTWKVTLDMILSNKEHGCLALEILDIVSYLEPRNIDRRMFLNLAGGDENKLELAIRLLTRYSMVNGKQEQSTLNVQRLVQEVIRLQLDDQKRTKEVIKKTYELLKSLFPVGIEGVEDYDRKEQLSPHLEEFLFHVESWAAKDPESASDVERCYVQPLLWLLAEAYSDLEIAENEVSVLTKLLRIESRLDATQVKVAKVFIKLGNATGFLQDNIGKILYLEKGIEILKNYPGCASETAYALLNLADAWRNLGESVAEINSLEKSIEIFRELYRNQGSPYDHEVSGAFVKLVDACHTLGSYVEETSFILNEDLLSTVYECYYHKDELSLAKVLLAVARVGSNPHIKKVLIKRAMSIFLDKHDSSLSIPRYVMECCDLENGLEYSVAEEEFSDKVISFVFEQNSFSSKYQATDLLLEIAQHYKEQNNIYYEMIALENAFATYVFLNPSGDFAYHKLIDLLCRIASAHRDIDNYYEEVDCLEEALSYYEQLSTSDLDTMLKIRLRLGIGYRNLENYDMQYYNLDMVLKTLKGSVSINNAKYHTIVAEALEGFIDACLYLKEYKQVFSYVSQSSEVISLVDYSDEYQASTVHRVLLMLEKVYNILGEHAKGRSCKEKALLVMERLNEVDFQTSIGILEESSGVHAYPRKKQGGGEVSSSGYSLNKKARERGSVEIAHKDSLDKEEFIGKKRKLLNADDRIKRVKSTGKFSSQVAEFSKQVSENKTMDVEEALIAEIKNVDPNAVGSRIMNVAKKFKSLPNNYLNEVSVVSNSTGFQK